VVKGRGRGGGGDCLSEPLPITMHNAWKGSVVVSDRGSGKGATSKKKDKLHHGGRAEKEKERGAKTVELKRNADEMPGK